jgi:hypothetical protein
MLSEVLRRAFRAVGEHGDVEGGDNIHGQFGAAAAWGANRVKVEAWMRANIGETEAIASAFLAGADPSLKAQTAELVKYLSQDVLDQIAGVADDMSMPASDLSQKLAEAGLLPMFGFPTRVRDLYHSFAPDRAYPWPPRNVIARDASAAISLWSPGSEVVKDKAIHRVVGVASYRPQGPMVISDPNPLGPRRLIGHCGQCGTINASPNGRSTCPICGAPPANGSTSHRATYRSMNICQPIGYRTDYRRKDYRDWFEWSPTSSRALMAAEDLGSHEVKDSLIGSGVSQIYEINDNAGREWRFAPTTSGDGWVCIDEVPKDGGGNIDYDQDAAERVALASVVKTDVLVVGVDPAAIPPGTTVQPITAAQRGAWYSLGFLLRGAAAQLLEVQTDEIDVGLRSLRINNVLTAQVFLSDSLANGAGYCSHLGSQSNFEDLLARAMGWALALESHRNSGKRCDSACYDCLKDYRNMAFHGLLDWRLAADLLDLLNGVAFDPEKRWADLAEQAIGSFAEAFGATLDGAAGKPVAVIGDRWLISAHPFESKDEALLPESLAEAVQSVRRRGGEPILTDHFDLLRRPAQVYGQLVS